MIKIWNWMQSHPWATGGIIFGIGTLYVLYVNSGSSSSNTSSSGMSSQEAALAAATEQYQTQLSASGIAADVENNKTSASVTIAGLEATTAQQYNTLSAQTSQIIAGLQASVADTQTAANVAVNKDNTDAMVKIALAPYQLAEDEYNSTASKVISNLENGITSALGILNTASGSLNQGYEKDTAIAAGGLTSASSTLTSALTTVKK
jgi:hypothetical protein